MRREVVEHMIPIHTRMLREEVGARFGAAKRFERQDFGIGAVQPAQVCQAACLPLARAAREDEGRRIGLVGLDQDSVNCVALTPRHRFVETVDRQWLARRHELGPGSWH